VIAAGGSLLSAARTAGTRGTARQAPPAAPDVGLLDPVNLAANSVRLDPMAHGVTDGTDDVGAATSDSARGTTVR
jgi:hypothetical protein